MSRHNPLTFARWPAAAAYALLATYLLLEPVPAQAAETDSAVKTAAAQKPGEDWVRVVRDDKGRPTALQTAIVRYVPVGKSTTDLKVDLVGAVHIGDAAYYKRLNKEFEQYDALLYELVAPEGTQIPQGGPGASRHPVGMLQNGIKEWLELEHQLAKIDYTKKNFVHADMSPEQFAESMKARGESFMKMLFRLMGRSLAMQSKLQAQGKATEFDLLAALLADDRARQLKIIMSEQFEEMESLLVGLGGPDGSTIISGRNQVALKVLKKQIAAGKTNVAIFYGAGHMQDMDRRLREQFKLKPVKTRWVTAWDLKAD